jgi:hypothetical protein
MDQVEGGLYCMGATAMDQVEGGLYCMGATAMYQVVRWAALFGGHRYGSSCKMGCIVWGPQLWIKL